jgi:hypothetical protein
MWLLALEGGAIPRTGSPAESAAARPSRIHTKP